MRRYNRSLLAISALAIAGVAAAPASQPTTAARAFAPLDATPDQLLPPAAHAASPGVAAATLSPDDHPRAAIINAAIQAAAATPEIRATGLTRDAYLAFIASEVGVMRTYQDADGRIIDPVEKREVQYATPCFAHAVSVLATSGQTKDATLIEAGMKAMDRAVWAMANNKVPDNHGDFFTWPVMLALSEYQHIAPAERWNGWRAALAHIDPSKIYNFYNNRQSLNWVIVHTSGEFLRHEAGMTGDAYVESMLTKQDHHFTPDGMYAEGGQPMAYDLFARLFVTGMLEHGYHGGHFEPMRQRMWMAAWMSLLMQSPTGEMPTGHRSAQHIWNEAEQCVIFETYAHAYATAGRSAEASMFKRAAHLSLATMRAWLRPDGSGYVVRNHFPIDAKFGYESYSAHTQYNLLACSMAAQAYEVADESVKEAAAPADAGGFVLVVEPFHKAFANASGGYVEYELRGDNDDRNWVPPGIVRIRVGDANAQIDPADAVGVYENKNAPADPSYAVGPAWQNADGSWTRLASLRPTTLPSVEAVEQSPKRCVMRITHALADGVSVQELITIEPKRVTVSDTVNGGDVRAVRAYFPMLVNDGAEDTQIKTDGNTATLKKSTGGAVQFSVDGVDALTRTGLRLNGRNGIVEPVYGEAAGRTITYHVANP